MAWKADRFEKLGEGGSIQVAKEPSTKGWVVSVFQELTWVKGNMLNFKRYGLSGKVQMKTEVLSLWISE